MDHASSPPVQPVATLPVFIQQLPEYQRKFAEFYALYGNAIQAGRYAGVGQTHDNNSSIYQWLKLPTVLDAIEYYRAEYARSAGFLPYQIVQEWVEMATVDITELFTEEWELKSKKDLSPVLRRAMVGLEVAHTKFGKRVKPRFAKFEALESLAKLWEMFGRDRQEEQVSPGTTVHITVGQNVQVSPDATPTVQVGRLSILPAEE